ncbi:DegV family protein [Adlercreutzia sp. ZJ304]|uniref:DegV family protein n=1 Tax=Adlercreutzia sp. ZJ304 TaxID=2709791 RepID=UPI0013E9A67E|nr:DegV family protein [Adlercreutzia sp. ZJ304]
MIRIITDSVASITEDTARKRNIEVVSLFVNYDGIEHVETEMDIDGFYETIEQRINNIPTSSQPSQHVLESILEDAAIAGDSVVGIFISSKLSGTLEGAIRAARMVKSRNINFQCAMIDSTSAGSDEAFVVLDAADKRDMGASFEEVIVAAELAVMRSRFLFIPESLAFLRAGGRIGAASALLGTVIQISPILTVVDGMPDTLAKVRTHKRAVAAMVQAFKSDVDEYGLKRVVVHYIGKKTKALEQLLETVREISGTDVEVHPVSPVVGVHVGPAIGIAYECVEFIKGKLTSDNPDLSVAV